MDKFGHLKLGGSRGVSPISITILLAVTLGVFLGSWFFATTGSVDKSKSIASIEEQNSSSLSDKHIPPQWPLIPAGKDRVEKDSNGLIAALNLSAPPLVFDQNSLPPNFKWLPQEPRLVAVEKPAASVDTTPPKEAESNIVYADQDKILDSKATPLNEQPLFTSSDIQELQESSRSSTGEATTRPQDSSRIGAGARRRAPEVNSQSVSADSPSENPESETPEEVLTARFGGQARGYQILSLMQPQARASTERLIQNLLRAEIDDVYLGVLSDGTFSKDFGYLRDVLRRLSTDGRSVTLALYLTNGSTMRRFDSTPITAGFNRVAPDDFRARIRFDPDTRNQFVEVVQEVGQIFSFNKQLNVRNSNIAIMMLEDNLDADSYRAMREIAAPILGNLVEYVRNPCLGCFEGNDATSLGDGLETHNAAEISLLSPGDGYTLDGVGYFYPGEASNGGFSIETVESVMLQAQERGIRYAGLWRRERQGIFGTGESVHPDLRNYEVPTDEQLEQDIKLLRAGLSEVVP